MQREMLQDIIVRDPPVQNQFLYEGGVGKSACVPMCIQAIFHLSEALRAPPNQELSILNQIQWAHVMTRGTRVWQLWQEANPMQGRFPIPADIFALKQCQGFYNLFKEEVIECGGLARTSKQVEDTEGSLQDLLASLVKKDSTAYALATMPGNATVALVCRPALRGNYSIFLFDPHGRAGTDRVTFLEFNDYMVTLEYLLSRYKIGSIDEMPTEVCLLATGKRCANCKKGEVCSFYNEMDLADTYQYAAYLFTNR